MMCGDLCGGTCLAGFADAFGVQHNPTIALRKGVLTLCVDIAKVWATNSGDPTLLHTAA